MHDDSRRRPTSEESRRKRSGAGGWCTGVLPDMRMSYDGTTAARVPEAGDDKRDTLEGSISLDNQKALVKLL